MSFIRTDYNLTKNQIKCLLCNTVIRSYTVHDFKWCQCGAVAVDGGLEYAKRVGNPYEYEDQSEWN